MNTITDGEIVLVVPTHNSLSHLRYSLSLSLSVFLVAPTLKNRASVKRFISLQFLIPKTGGRTPWKGDQPVARPLPTQDNTNTD
jgi:hypothetical protein